MQYTFLKCSRRTQKLVKIKCTTFMPLNVLSTPIPFGIRNGIIWTHASVFSLVLL